MCQSIEDNLYILQCKAHQGKTQGLFFADHRPTSLMYLFLETITSFGIEIFNNYCMKVFLLNSCPCYHWNCKCMILHLYLELFFLSFLKLCLYKKYFLCVKAFDRYQFNSVLLTYLALGCIKVMDITDLQKFLTSSTNN